ncbi:MAG: T9SS type A sorting domain-containing protein [Ignavibacteriales bacterium]|nr:T9SS type A sorting domain-containing protein [Ignavibacteriales bacterium]
MANVNSQMPNAWEKIGFITGNGTSTEVHTYSFFDKNPVEGKSNYRLKQIDFDGSFEYSNIIEVDFTLPIVFSLEQNYPNPFNPTTSIRYAISSMKNVQLIVYNVLGKEVAMLVNEVKPAGIYEIDFNAASLASGVYFYKLQAGNFVETKK